MLASVVIPSFQSATTIRACLESVLAQDLGEPFEVLVADSGSDSASAVVRRDFPTVRVLESKERLDAESARNWGAREARGAVLAFIDSDCVADPSWLRRLCTTIESGPYDGVGGAIRNEERANAASWAGYFCEFREFLPRGAAVDRTYLTPGNVAYRADVFHSSGGFQSGYFPLEDQAFYRRLKAIGARIRFDPTIVVTHVHRSEVSKFLAHQAKIGVANSRLVRALGLQGRTLASHRWAATALLPALATYRFGRTVAACWTHDRFLMLRRPAIAGLCWLGMLAWGLGFAQPDAVEARLPRGR